MSLMSHVLPYVLLVSFYSGTLDGFDDQKIRMINQSPFNGVAIQVLSAYDTSPINPSKMLQDSKYIQGKMHTHLWPWVFFNRFIGFKADGRGKKRGNQDYFKKIRGIDIFNEAGALGDFFTIWKTSLLLAKQSGSPGIFVDSEAYNNYLFYQVNEISREIGKSNNEVRDRLKAVGAELVEIANETYPNATIWFTFTGFLKPMRVLLPYPRSEFRSTTYIILGMLEAAKKTSSRLKFVSGGMVSQRYCNTNLHQLEGKIEKRTREHRDLQTEFPFFYLGATIAPWVAKVDKTAWLLKGDCEKSDCKEVGDFEPYLRRLFKGHQYVWIYAAKAAKYDPYSNNKAHPINKIIDNALISLEN